MFDSYDLGAAAGALWVPVQFWPLSLQITELQLAEMRFSSPAQQHEGPRDPTGERRALLQLPTWRFITGFTDYLPAKELCMGQIRVILHVAGCRGASLGL